MHIEDLIACKDDWITEDFLGKNNFKRDLVGCGEFPYRKTINDCEIVITLNTDCGNISMSIYNDEKTMTISKPKYQNRLLKSELKYIMEFFKLSIIEIVWN